LQDDLGRIAMGIRYLKEPKLENPEMVACWPGIGNIGTLAVDTLRGQIGAEAFAEIEPWDFSYPKKLAIRAGVVTRMEFPSSRFHSKTVGGRDVIIFLGEEQPADTDRMYAHGRKAEEMGNLVLDVAQRFGCRRIYTSGAAVSLVHHQARPRVWVVATSESLLKDLRRQENTVLMSEIEGIGGSGSITGLNGLLLGLARKRGMDAACLMGEIPDYLSGAPFPYARASKSVLEVLSRVLGAEIDYGTLNAMIAQVDAFVETIYENLPAPMKERIEQRKLDRPSKQEPITEDDAKWIKEHVDELFKKGDKGGERPS